METTNVNTPKCRRLRISLRVLIVAVLATGLWMGCLVNKARRQREAVAAVKKYGGWVHSDWQSVNGKVTKGTQPNAPNWLKKLLGDEYFQEIAQVSLVYDVSNGKRYDIKNDLPADDVLSSLVGMANLKVLLLQGKQATDQGLKHLGQLISLEELVIWDASQVTDIGIGHLESLRNLRYIHIGNSKMSDRGLASLAKLPKLESVALQGNSFTDAGLALLKDSTNLKSLCVGLGTTRITDAGMVNLKNLKNLEMLDLRNTGVTDVGLDRLRLLTKLRVIFVENTHVTKEGVIRIEAAMPHLRVRQ